MKRVTLVVMLIIAVVFASVIILDSMISRTPQTSQGQTSDGSQVGNASEGNSNDEVKVSDTNEGGEDRQNKLIRYIRTSGDTSMNSASVDVVFLNPVEGLDTNELVFEVLMNTHSVDLEEYDLSKIARIETSTGTTVEDGFRWETEEGGGHHLSGILRVSDTVGSDKILSDDVEWIKLVITGIPGVEIREFEWSKDLF